MFLFKDFNRFFTLFSQYIEEKLEKEKTKVKMLNEAKSTPPTPPPTAAAADSSSLSASPESQDKIAKLLGINESLSQAIVKQADVSFTKFQIFVSLIRRM